MSNPSLKISVALCTYNGEQFLGRQLESIRQQNKLPNELIVCDDASTDDTVAILKSFAALVSFPVRIHRNEQNVGFVANFERAIRLCEGDLIVLSDQDDIWYPNRLECSLQTFVSHPDVGLVFADADVIDDQDQLTGTRLWQNFGFAGELKQQMLAGNYIPLVKNRFVTGATVVFRSRLRESCLPFGSGWLHDEWLVATAAGVANVQPIDVPLIRYRTHTAQQVGLSPRPSFREKNRRHWTELSRQISMLENICSHLSKQTLTERGGELLACYQAHLRFARFRYALPQNRLGRLNAILSQPANYFVCGSGVRSIATDLVLNK